MIDLMIGFVLASVLFVAEYLLCTKLKYPLWGDWGTGREKHKKLQQAEIDKMIAKDIG